MTEVTTDKPISPAEPGAPGQSAPALGMAEQVHLRRAQKKTNSLLWGIFVLLLVLVGGVIFILPNYVAPPDPEVDTVAINAAAVAAATPAETPFEEAQRMRQRDEAQTTLASLLELQDALETKQVQQWAETEFNAAIELARQGDEAYATQNFTGANALYQSSLAKLQDIDAGQSGIYEERMQQAAAAYAAGNAAAAEEAYGQALLLQPDSNDALTGMERARVLTQVLDLLDEGRELQSSNELEAARTAYQQALALDAAHSDANAALTAVNNAIVERNFAAAMSRGYAALQGGRPDEAQEAFKQALAIKPGSPEVTAAMQQAEDQETFAAISVHVEQAQQHESDENWAEAIVAWDQALAVDPNLVSAQEGRRLSDSRNKLDIYLKSIIADPLRLADQAVQAQARQVLSDAASLSGPNLQGQLQQVRGFLERINVPANVQLQSDGMTSVTVYRVGELGMFTNHTLSLAPGAYTAVGVRPGYRDVRQEFVVAIDGQTPVVTVACTEAI
jgi:tetratricopeptide (TPR) repeat protein